jgi:hypothetical protein
METTTTTKVTVEVTFISPLVASGKFRRSPEGVPMLTDYQWTGYIAERNRYGKYSFFYKYRDYISVSSRYINLLDNAPSHTDMFYADVVDAYFGNKTQVEVIPPGCRCVVTFICHGESALDAVKTALNEGSLLGFGFCRRGGYGRFTWKEVTDNG